MPSSFISSTSSCPRELIPLQTPGPPIELSAKALQHVWVANWTPRSPSRNKERSTSRSPHDRIRTPPTKQPPFSGGNDLSGVPGTKNDTHAITVLFQNSVEGLNQTQNLFWGVIEVVVPIRRNVLDHHSHAGIVSPRVVETERLRFPRIDLLPVHAVRDVVCPSTMRIGPSAITCILFFICRQLSLL